MDEDSGTGLPASIEAAWGLRDRPHKGPKPGLSLESIVDAAVKVASADGLAAVSMSRVAAELGAATMSLYRYVAAKDELLQLMVDAALGPPPDDPIPAGDWRSGLSSWAWAYFDFLRRCPWVVRIPISAPPITPNNIAWFERGLSALRDTGLDGGEKVGVILLISGYVRSAATLSADVTEAIQAAGGQPGPVLTAYGRLLTKLTDAERFPALHDVIATGALDDAAEEDEDADVVFAIECILDGIEVLVRARSAPSGG